MSDTIWSTEIIAVDPKSGTLKKYGGPIVPGESEADARQYCDENGLGYVRILGQTLTGVSGFEMSKEAEIQIRNLNNQS